MCLALVLVVGSVSGVNLILPAVAVDLEASGSALTWIADAYTLVLAALVLPMGALGDRLGRRNVLLVGTIVLGAGAVLGAAAGSTGVLVGARAVMGVGAAMIMPGTLSTITAVFPAEQRARAVGIWSGFSFSGGVLGMLLSGGLLEAFSWVSTFVATAAIAAVAFVAAAVLSPNTADPDQAHVDAVGSMLSGVAFGGVVFGIIEGVERGWSDPLAVLGLVGAALGLAGWVLWSLHIAHPLLDPRLFRLRGFATGSAAITLQFLVTLGFFLVGLQFLQLILGYSALISVVALLPVAAVAMPASVVAPALAARFGVRPVIAGGMAATAAGFLLLSQLEADSTYWSFLVGLCAFGVGTALASAPSTTAIVTALPRSKQGVASAVNDVSRELGAAIGIATLGSLFNRGYRDAISTTVDDLPAAVAEVVERSPAAGLDIASQLGPDGTTLGDGVRDAFIDGMTASLVGGVVIALVGIAFIVWRGPRRNETAMAEADIDVDPAELHVRAPVLAAASALPASGRAAALDAVAAPRSGEVSQRRRSHHRRSRC